MRLAVVALVSLCTAMDSGAGTAEECATGNRREVSAKALWDTGAADEPILTCVVEKDRILGHQLRILRGSTELFVLGEGDSFLGMFPTSESGGHLVTLWATGSAYKTLVLQSEPGGIRVVLDVGSRQFPEIVYEDVNDPPVFLITHHHWVVREGGREFVPETTQVFKFANGAYRAVARLPWLQRFQAIRREQAGGPP